MAKAQSTNRTGSPMNLYMRQEEKDKVRDLAAWLQGLGFRTSDSRVIAAAVKVAKKDNHLKDAYKEIDGADARRAKNK